MKIVHVGVADGKVFPVYTDLMIHLTGFFRTLFRGCWKETETLEVKLGDCEWALMFLLLVEFVTRVDITPVVLDQPAVEKWGSEAAYRDHERPTWRECVNLWLLGDYL